MSNVKDVDVVKSICSLTGLKPNIVNLVLRAQTLSVLNELLVFQIEDTNGSDEVDYIRLGSLTIDITDYSDVKLTSSDELRAKMLEVTKTGRDYLAESIATEFTDELRARYISSEYQDIFEHDTPIYIDGDTDE